MLLPSRRSVGDSTLAHAGALARGALASGHATLELGAELALAASSWARAWEDMPLDPYLEARFGERRRRFAAFSLELSDAPSAPSGWQLLADAVHVQGREYNRLFGDLPRRFAAIEPSFFYERPWLFLQELFERALGELTPEASTFLAELHTFRVAPNGARAWPTPEGVHQDGRDWVFILLVGRSIESGGALEVLDLTRTPIARYPLEAPGALVLLDDRRVFHVTEPIAGRGTRDVLVTTFRRGAP